MGKLEAEARIILRERSPEFRFEPRVYICWKIAPAIARSCFGSEKMADSCFQDRSHGNTIVLKYTAKVDMLHA